MEEEVKGGDKCLSNGSVWLHKEKIDAGMMMMPLLSKGKHSSRQNQNDPPTRSGSWQKRFCGEHEDSY